MSSDSPKRPRGECPVPVLSGTLLLGNGIPSFSLFDIATALSLQSPAIGFGLFRGDRPEVHLFLSKSRPAGNADCPAKYLAMSARQVTVSDARHS